MKMMKTATQAQYQELISLQDERTNLRHAHANSPLDCYSLAQKILIQRDRKEAIDAITAKINALLDSFENAGVNS